MRRIRTPLYIKWCVRPLLYTNDLSLYNFACACYGNVSCMSIIQEHAFTLTLSGNVLWLLTRVIDLTARRGYSEILEYILSIYKVSKHTRGEALSVACRNNRVCVVSVLIKSGVDVDYGDGRPLLYAAMNSPDSVPLLIQAGADINISNSTAIKSASECGQIDTVRLLIASGCLLYTRIATDAMCKALTHHHTHIAELFIGSTVNADTLHSKFLLNFVRAGNVEAVEFLLKHGRTIGLTKALNAAITFSHPQIVDILKTRIQRQQRRPSQKK